MMGQAKDNRALRLNTMTEFKSYWESHFHCIAIQYADLTESNCSMFKALKDVARDAWFSARGVTQPYIGEE